MLYFDGQRLQSITPNHRELDEPLVNRTAIAPATLASLTLFATVLVGVAMYLHSPSLSKADRNADHLVESAPLEPAQVNDSARELSSAVTMPGKATLVGRQVCRECHAENFQLHSRHGHASTFHWVSDTDLPDRFAGKKFDAGKDFGTYEYERDSNNKLYVKLKSKFGDKPFPLPYALGSRLHAQTLLTLVPSPDGSPDSQTEGIEHRVSCYPDGSIALTPGHSIKSPTSSLELFGAIAKGVPLERCVYCHTTRGKIAGDSVKDLIANVNCEKCHGPGSEHVRLARANPKPPPYSVGHSTWDAESELQLCGDCHRLPRDVSEEKVREYPDLLIRFQPIGMLRSRCYLGSKNNGSSGEMRCTTCHNPHQSLQELKEADHVSDCVKCHQTGVETHVVCPVEPTTGCIDCHMPAVELDNIRFHDHWIRVHDDAQ